MKNNKYRPQDDFYNYINSEFLENVELPSGYPSWGSFEKLYKKSLDDVKDLIKNFNKNPKNISEDAKKIITLFNNYMNDKARDEQGLKPLIPLIEQINGIKDKKEITDLLIKLHGNLDFSFFHSKSIDSDFKDSNIKALAISSMGLGMSDRDFYEKDHIRHNEIKTAYKKYVQEVIEYSKVDIKSKDNFFDILYVFEEKMASIKLKNEELRIPEKIYNIFTLEELDKICPILNWTKYFTALGYSKAKKIIVLEPKFFEGLNEYMQKISLDDLKDILIFRTIKSYGSLLSSKLYEISFNYSSVFNGLKEMKPKEDRAIEFVNSTLGELVGKEYVKLHFSEESKNKVLAMVNDLIEVYENRINKLDWMSDTTKKKAIEKLNSFVVKIGYPDKWEDYSKIEIKSFEEGSSLIENILNIGRYFLEKEIKEIELPVDKTKWYMFPQTVNAYYNPTSNEICFPAGILQPPFFDINKPLATNLGGIGAVIGHEVSHGFDDEGSKFDKNGNLENWWTKEDHKAYSLRTKALEEQYGKYKVKDSFVNGKLTLGENIGDLSGVEAAISVCLKHTKNREEDLKLFFENYAITWCRKSTDELKNTRLLTDPHSPEEFRCNGVLVNIDEFHEVYKTKDGDKLYKPKEDRIKIW